MHHHHINLPFLHCDFLMGHLYKSHPAVSYVVLSDSKKKPPMMQLFCVCVCVYRFSKNKGSAGMYLFAKLFRLLLGQIKQTYCETKTVWANLVCHQSAYHDLGSSKLLKITTTITLHIWLLLPLLKNLQSNL